MAVVDSFVDNVFEYINNQYGRNILKQVQSENNKSTVSRLLKSSAAKSDSVEHTANKIIAMLRMNP